MSAPLVPSPLDYIGPRRFALYPAIADVAPNEWVLGIRAWSEVQVINSHTGSQMWIPRQYIGGVSDRYDSVLVVELTKELEYKSGLLEPRIKRVIEMPQASAEDRPKLFEITARRGPGPAAVVAIRTESREDSSVNKALVTLGAGAIAVYLLAALISALARSS